MSTPTVTLAKTWPYLSYCLSCLNIYKNISSKGRDVVGEGGRYKRRVSKWRPNAKVESPSSCHMLSVHSCHHFHSRILFEPSLLQPLSAAAFHKELDDSCGCWENQSLIFLSSEVSEDGATCHHLTSGIVRPAVVRLVISSPTENAVIPESYNSCSHL